MPKTKVKIPEEVEKKVREAVVLLRLDKDSSLNIFKKLAVAAQIEMLDNEIRSLAEARLVGETGVAAMKMSDVLAQAGDPAEVRAEWDKVATEYQQKKTTWADPAKKSEVELQQAIKSYAQAMEPLITAFDGAKASHVPGVKAKATEAQATLVKARDTLKPLSDAANKAIKELEDYEALGNYLVGDPPQTIMEVRGFRARYDESIAKCRNADLDVKRQVDDINKLCSSSQKKVEKAIKDMCAAALAWENTKDVREVTELVESVGNGSVAAAQVIAGEPLSAVAVQGLHMLIKGVCTAINFGAAGIEQRKLGKKDAMDLAGELKGDTFIQWKLDLIQTGLEWAAEPLGFIPSVGTIVRAAINVATKAVTGTLKKAAEKQAKKPKTPKPNPGDYTEEIKEVKNILWEQFKETVKTYEEKFAELPDMIAGKKDPAEAIIEIAAAIFGPPLEAVLVKIVPSFDMVSPDQVKATLQGARDSVATLAKERLKVSQVNLKFAFDESAAKQKSLDTLHAMQKGASATVMVARSQQFKDTRGVGLLIGSGHSQDNISFMQSLIKEKSGWEGVMTLVKDGSSGELRFIFPDDQAADLVKKYVKHYGSGDNRITRKTLTFS